MYEAGCACIVMAGAIWFESGRHVPAAAAVLFVGGLILIGLERIRDKIGSE